MLMFASQGLHLGIKTIPQNMFFKTPSWKAVLRFYVDFIKTWSTWGLLQNQVGDKWRPNAPKKLSGENTFLGHDLLMHFGRPLVHYW